jgi:hypothetical protein
MGSVGILDLMGRLWPMLSLALAVAVALSTGCGASPVQPKSVDNPDLAQIQGTWKRNLGRKGHILKQISGSREIISHYDRRGRLTAEHSAEIGVGRRESPLIRVFHWRNLVVSMGGQPAWPHNQTEGQYVYACDNARFIEYQWSVGDLPAAAKPRIVVWKRADYGTTPAPAAYAPPQPQPQPQPGGPNFGEPPSLANPGAYPQ